MKQSDKLTISPVGSLLVCAIMEGKISVRAANIKYKSTCASEDLPLSDNPIECYEKWLDYFGLPELDYCYLITNNNTFHFVEGVVDEDDNLKLLPDLSSGCFSIAVESIMRTEHQILSLSKGEEQ